MSLYYVHRSGQTTGPFPSDRLTAMISAGEMKGSDLVCAMGAEEWQPVASALDHRVVRQTRRPYVALTAILIILGVVGVVVFWPVGLLLIVLGLVADRTHHSCGACGNRVEQTSQMCPTCRAELMSEAEAGKKRE